MDFCRNLSYVLPHWSDCMKIQIRKISVLLLIVLLVGCLPSKTNPPKENTAIESTATESTATNTFSLQDPDEVMKDTLLNPFVNKTKIKILGDSITAGMGSTGYGLTGQEIGHSGYFIPKQDSLSWANLMKQYVENKYNNKLMLVNPLNSRITSNFPKIEQKDNRAKLKMSAYTNKKDAKWKFSFVGTEFNVYFTKRSDSGIVDIYVDGTRVEQIDLYRQNPQYEYKVSVKDLGQGEHNVEIREAGKNSKSTGNRIYIEALEFYKKASVQNWGVSGRDSEWIYELKDTLIEPSDDIVMLQIGSNDRRDMTSPEALKMHIQAIIRKCIEEKKEIILLSANATSIKDDALRDDRKFTMLDIDMVIKELADEYGIQYISNYDAFLRYSDYSGTPIDALLKDGQHPNDAGYQIMYKNVMRSLGLSLERD